MHRLTLFVALVIAAFLLGRATAPVTAPRPALAARDGGESARIALPVGKLPRGAAAEPEPFGGSPYPGQGSPHATQEAPNAASPIAASVEGRGFLEIRNAGDVSEYELKGRNLRGEWVEVEYEPKRRNMHGEWVESEGIELRSGPYRLSASRDSEPGPRIYRITIEPGATVIVDLARAPTPELFPLDPGLGRLDIAVTDTQGSPLRDVQISISARGDTVDGDTGGGGRTRFDVLPGRYRVVVGALEQFVLVQEGRTRVLNLDGRATGEINLVGIMYRHASIRALDPLHADINAFDDGGSVRYVLLEPGRYEIFCHILPQQRVLLDTVVVAAGRRVRIEPEPPGVFVRFRFPFRQGALHRTSLRIESAAGEVFPSTSVSMQAVLFKRGRYTAVVDDKHYVSDPVAFEADSDEVVVTIPVRGRRPPPK